MPHERHHALLITDMLEEFVNGKIRAPNAREIVVPIIELSSAARRSKVPVIYACDSHFPNDPEISVWGPHAMRGTSGARIIAELRPSKHDFVLEKRVYSAFQETGLELLLRNLGADSVVITGLVTEICVRHTAADAFMRGFNVIVPRDCVGPLKRSNQMETLDYIEKMYNAEIISSAKLIKRWLR